jgi:hypothetical protein
MNVLAPSKCWWGRNPNPLTVHLLSEGLPSPGILLPFITPKLVVDLRGSRDLPERTRDHNLKCNDMDRGPCAPTPLPFPQSWELSRSTANPSHNRGTLSSVIQQSIDCPQTTIDEFISGPPGLPLWLACPASQPPQTRHDCSREYTVGKEETETQKKHFQPGDTAEAPLKTKRFSTLQQEHFLAPGTRRFP